MRECSAVRSCSPIRRPGDVAFYKWVSRFPTIMPTLVGVVGDAHLLEQRNPSSFSSSGAAMDDSLPPLVDMKHVDAMGDLSEVSISAPAHSG
jgi:hypothetical protein